MDHAYAIYEANLADEARANARRDEAANADPEPYRPDRLCLLDARFSRCLKEAQDLVAEIDARSWELRTANDQAEMWMRALESALAQAREALGHITKAAA